MIVDCFTFYNEFETLELRLEILDRVVDRFVICEAPFTFRGVPKPLYFRENAERFARWRDRITLVTYPGPPAADPWANEHGQRDYLITGLNGCAPDDLILIGDVDEIPRPELIGRRPAPGGMLVYNLMMLRGSANRADGDGAEIFGATRALAFGDIPNLGGGKFSVIRLMPHPLLEHIVGGWHFTSMGGAAVMHQKMQTYSHREYDVPYWVDERRLGVNYGYDGGTNDARVVPFDRLPAELRDPKWQRFMWTPRPTISRERGAQLEHAHGLAAYVPDGAASVAVLARELDAWADVGSERFGDAFAGIYASIDVLTGSATAAEWIVIDGLERFPAGTLAALCRRGAGAIAFVTNARSHRTLKNVFNGDPFGPGRLLGRPEAEAEIAASGYALPAPSLVANRQLAWAQIPPGLERVYHATVAPFTIAELAAGELHAFQSDAFVFTLTPSADTV